MSGKRLIILVAALLIAAASIWYVNKDRAERPPNYFEMVNQSILTQLKPPYPELVRCDNITDEYLLGGCYTQLAVGLNESAICALPPTNRTRDECYIKLAARQRNAFYCVNVVNNVLRDSCLSSVAVATKNQFVCEGILSESTKYRCLSLTMNEPGLCLRIQDENAKESCLISYRRRKNDVNACALIADQQRREECILEHVSKNKLSSKLCQSIENATLRSMCRQEGIVFTCPLTDLPEGLISV